MHKYLTFNKSYLLIKILLLYIYNIIYLLIWKLTAAGTNICKSKKSGLKNRANFDQKIIVFVFFFASNCFGPLVQTQYTFCNTITIGMCIQSGKSLVFIRSTFQF